MRVIIDTNVWVNRLLVSGSTAARAVDRALGEFQVMVSEAVIEELADVLSRQKFDRYVTFRDRQDFLRRVLQVTKTAPVLSVVEDCGDPDDNRLLALALDSQSGCVVAEDRDLLSLDPWRGIAIVTPASFLVRDA